MQTKRNGQMGKYWKVYITGIERRGKLQFTQQTPDFLSFPDDSVVKNPPITQVTHRRLVFHAWVREIPWSRKWQSTPLFLPGKFHGQRSLPGYSPQHHKELDVTEVTQHTCVKCQTKPEFLNLDNTNFWVQIILCGGELPHGLQDVWQCDFHRLDASSAPPGIVATKSLLILPHVPGGH